MVCVSGFAQPVAGSDAGSTTMTSVPAKSAIHSLPAYAASVNGLPASSGYGPPDGTGRLTAPAGWLGRLAPSPAARASRCQLPASSGYGPPDGTGRLTAPAGRLGRLAPSPAARARRCHRDRGAAPGREAA